MGMFAFVFLVYAWIDFNRKEDFQIQRNVGFLVFRPGKQVHDAPPIAAVLFPISNEALTIRPLFGKGVEHVIVGSYKRR